MSDCARFRELIEQRLSGPLPEARRLELAEHCAACPDCAELKVADAEMTAFAEGLEPTAAELLEIRRAVLRQARRDASEPHAKRWRAPWWRAALAAAALVLAAGGFVLGRRSGSAASLDRDPVMRELQRVALVSKTIRATGRQGAGTHRIVLRTINGDVYLSRAAGASK